MKLLIRADASIQIGTGHVMRCLALAQAWIADGGQVIFLMCPGASKLEARLQCEGIEVKNLLAILGSMDDAQETAKIATKERVNWVVLDSYLFNADYQKSLKDMGLRLLCLDDYGHAEHYYSDLVLNQNISACTGDYSNREAYTELLLGTKYILLRKEFWQWQGWKRKIPSVARKVLVTMGGSDPSNVTLMMLQAIQQIEIKDLETIVIIGGENPHHENLEKEVENTSATINLKQNVTNMPKLMAWADLAITGGGSTCWELAFMGLPSLVTILAENQYDIAMSLEKMEVATCLGSYESLSAKEISSSVFQLLTSSKIRRINSLKGQEIVDSNKGFQIVKILKERIK